MNKSILKLGRGWIIFWAFKCSLLAASVLASYYPKKMKQQMGRAFKHVVLISRYGHTSCYLKTEEKEQFGLYQIKKYIKPNGVKKFCQFLNKKTTQILADLNHLNKNGQITNKEFKKIIYQIQEYLGYYAVPRQIIDHINSNKVSLVLNDLKQARLLAEPVFGLFEEIIQKFCRQLVVKAGNYNTRLFSSMSINEMIKYLQGRKLIDKKELEKRYEHSAMIITPGKYLIVNNSKTVSELEKLNIEKSNDKTINGTIAFKGIAKGVARIIFDPAKVQKFNQGDILITGMTRPDYLALMKKSSAIVTDIGGLLCHAAIVAREIKKPCIIGTKIATKVLRDGDYVEVDADKGIVKIIK